jgi:5-formyltetrahydrofolate cyclo-ligase
MVAPHPLCQQEPRVTEAPAAASDTALRDAKAAARKLARIRRAALINADAPMRLAEALLAHHTPAPGAIIAGYWPMGEEMDPRALMLALAAGGHRLALPVTPPRGQPLTFRAWAPGAALRAGPMGISEPISGDELRPDILLVPLLAFDRAMVGAIMTARSPRCRVQKPSASPMRGRKCPKCQRGRRISACP